MHHGTPSTKVPQCAWKYPRLQFAAVYCKVFKWRDGGEGKRGGMVLALAAKPNLGPEEAATPKPAEENRKQTSSKL